MVKGEIFETLGFLLDTNSEETRSRNGVAVYKIILRIRSIVHTSYNRDNGKFALVWNGQNVPLISL